MQYCFTMSNLTWTLEGGRKIRTFSTNIQAYRALSFSRPRTAACCCQRLQSEPHAGLREGRGQRMISRKGD